MATKQFKNLSSITSTTRDQNRKTRARKSRLDKLEQESMTQGGLPFTREDDGSISLDLSSMEGDNYSDTSSYEASEFYDNLVSELIPEELQRLGAMVKANFEADKQSRSEWESMITQGTTLLGLKLEEKNSPFRGACSAQHPLLMESAVKFQSKSSNELLPATGPARSKILGEATIEKEAQANRVAAHLNYQLTEEMTEFYTDTERMLLYLPLFGSAFKKAYYCTYEQRPVSEFVPADQLVVPNNAPDLYRSDRYTHILYKTQSQLDEDFASKFYHKPEVLSKPATLEVTGIQKALNSVQGLDVSFNTPGQASYTLYEQHVQTCIYKNSDMSKALDPYEDMPEDCLASPYIITINSTTGEVLGVRRNWKEQDSKRCKKVPFVPYVFVPGFGFYGLGFLHLLGNLQLSLTASLRSLVDAGQFATLQGGFKLKGVRIIDDGEPISPGQFKEIDSSILDINKSIMRLPFGEPSQTLFSMLQYLTQAGQKFADATEQVLGEATNYGPVGTTMALLDASTKFFSAIHKRLHNSLKMELRIIAEINAETLADDLPYNKNAGNLAISRSDYDETMDVVPVSDPNISSNAHRMAKAQTIMQVAMQAPELHDMREVLKHFYTAVDYGNIDKILPPPQTAQTADPMTDIQSAVQGLPIKAFPGQDHQSHVMIKSAFLQDPNSGKSPLMQKAAMSIQANIQEHMMLGFIEATQAQMQIAQGGQVNPQEAMQAPQGGTQDPQAMAMAQAAQQVAVINQMKLQQMVDQAQQNPKDHAALVLAQAELMDSQTQQRKQQFDEHYKVAQTALANKKLDIHQQDSQLKAQQFGAKLAHDSDKLITSKGIDNMTNALNQGHEAKMQQRQLDAQKQNKKPSPTK